MQQSYGCCVLVLGGATEYTLAPFGGGYRVGRGAGIGHVRPESRISTASSMMGAICTQLRGFAFFR